MRSKKNAKKILDLLGRDPTCGRVQGRAGAHLTLKDKLRNRNSKWSRRQIKRENDENPYA